MSWERGFFSHIPSVLSYVLESQDSTKYLGEDIQSSLSWKTHIDRIISKKSNSMLSFLRRNLRSCSEETKANACFSMVRSNLEYFSTVWSPHHKDQIHLIEMAQRRAARHMTNRFRNTSSVSSMIEQTTMGLKIQNSVIPLLQSGTQIDRHTRHLQQ